MGRPAYVPVPWDEGEVVLDEKGSPKLLSESSKRALYSEIEAALRGRDPRTSAELSGTERTYIHPHQGHLGINLRDSGGSTVNGPISGQGRSFGKDFLERQMLMLSRVL